MCGMDRPRRNPAGGTWNLSPPAAGWFPGLPVAGPNQLLIRALWPRNARLPPSGMPNMPTHLARAALLCALASACAEPTPSDRPTTAGWTDSVRLAESETTFIGAPGGLTVVPGRAVYVSDAAAGQVLAFSWDGSLVGTIGRRGRGPGELLVPGALDVVDGDLLVLDNPTARLSRFRVGDGALLGAARLPGPSLDVRGQGSRAWTSTALSALGTSLALWEAGSDSMRVAGRLPASYTLFPRLQRAMAIGAIAVAPDGIWIGMQGSNAIERFTFDALTVPRDSVEVPRRVRRGVPLDRPEELRREVSYEDEVASVSLLMGVGALGDGRLATAHVDARLDPATESVTARSFLTIVQPGERPACVDLTLPLDSTAIPTLRFVGDELYALERRDGAPPTGGAWLLRMNVARLPCEGARPPR